MIIDECLLVYVHSQEEPPPPKLTTRAAKRAAALRAENPQELQIPTTAPKSAMHSIDELSIIGCFDAMPAMQAVRRVRAPMNMSVRPRLSRSRGPAPRREDLDRKIIKKSKSQDGEYRQPRRKASEVKTRIPPFLATPLSIITSLQTVDSKMKARAIELASEDIHCEPVIPMNTAIRVVLQATLDLGRPYDTNMLASTMGVTRSLVMQSLRKYYQDFVEQSLFTEADFVPTYLWLYGLDDDPSRAEAVKRAIKLSGADQPGSRSVFAIARDFVILYTSEMICGTELSALSSVTAMMNKIKIPKDVPPCFLEMTNSFLYRARMTGRTVLKTKPELIEACGGTIAGLFV